MADSRGNYGARSREGHGGNRSGYGGNRPGGGGFRGRGDFGGGGNRKGGTTFYAGRKAEPSETWTMPEPGDPQPIPELDKPAGSLPKYDTEIIPLQKPKPPGTVNFAEIKCLTNYFELKLGTKYPAAYFYTVKISKRENAAAVDNYRSKGPKKERKLSMEVNRKVFAQVPRNAFGDQMLAYDGRQRACGVKRILNDGLELNVDLDGEKWLVSLSYEKSVPLNCLKSGEDYFRDGDYEESLLCLALFLNHMPSMNYLPIGKGFYGLPGGKTHPILGGFECWTGYKAHTIPTEDKLCLNVNHAITVFLKPGKLIDLLPELCLRGDRRLPLELHHKQIGDLNKKLSRCKIEVTHAKNCKFTIHAVTREPATRVFFRDRNNRQVSVAQFFEQTYFKLKYPNYPCVQIGFKASAKYFPLEVVTILPGNPFRGEQTSQMTTEIIRLAAIPPRNRLEEIRAAVKTIRKQSELDTEFDMQIGEEVHVPARILPPPKLVAHDDKRVAVNPGVLNFGNHSFFKGSRIEKWTVIVTDKAVPLAAVDSFVKAFCAQARKMGVALGEPLQIRGEFHSLDDGMAQYKVEENIEKFVTEHELQFVLFVISNFTRIHAAIKYTCDVKLGVSSKCVKTQTITKDNVSPCILNIVYGLNPKFEGENVIGIDTEFAHNLLSSCPTLIIAMDVNHGKAKIREGLAKMPSTVGIVGTRNMNATLYNAYMRAQRKPPNSADREVIQEHIMKDAVYKLFMAFRDGTDRFPERVVVYRDGVSNGQFQAVLQKEMKAIIDVCRNLNADYRPPITFVTVQKRHDTRLFPEKVIIVNKKEKQNPIAGTVVDRELTGPRVWNFFMASHEGIQGTSKPAHYTVLLDENDFSNDQLQSLTYYLCHLYGKCPRAVSIPAPVYYAHHVAFRAAELGAFGYQETTGGQECKRYSSKDPERLEREELNLLRIYNEAASIRENYAGTMYFL